MAQDKFNYLDYASTTPLDSKVFEAMRPFFTKKFANPATLYKLGREAKAAIDNALQKIAAVLHCAPREFIFAGSATESNNLAILGAARANRKFGNKIIISNVEHKSVSMACEVLAKEGFQITKLRVRKDGLAHPKDLNEILDKKTILVSIIYADNETGTIQPIAELAQIIKNFRRKNNRPAPYFHTDATQAVLYLDLNVEKLSVDLLTMSGHKIYGPKGIGGLYIREGVAIQPMNFGGVQQNKLRPGTENTPGIVGLGEALALARSNKKFEYNRIKKLRDKLEQEIFKSIPKVVLNGHPQKRLPNFLNVSILDIEGEAALLHLDQEGIFVSTGSACNSQSLEPSHVLTALGRPYEYIHGSLRFSLGKYTRPSMINHVLKCLPKIVTRLRQISPLKLKIGKEGTLAQPEAFLHDGPPHFLKEE